MVAIYQLGGARSGKSASGKQVESVNLLIADVPGNRGNLAGGEAGPGTAPEWRELAQLP
jgi:hypothetical protein